jgi:hypothetical protein
MKKTNFPMIWSQLHGEAEADSLFLQTLKERFAEQLPEKIEQIKKLRK